MIAKRRLVFVNNVDITPNINQKTYTMERTQEYESWQDGNWVEHRIYGQPKVRGSFEVNFIGINAYNDFRTNFMQAVTNNKVTISVRILNENVQEAIEAFYKFETIGYNLLMDDDDFVRVKITLEEA